MLVFTFENPGQNGPNWCCHEAYVANLQHSALLEKWSDWVYIPRPAFPIGVAAVPICLVSTIALSVYPPRRKAWFRGQSSNISSSCFRYIGAQGVLYAT